MTKDFVHRTTITQSKLEVIIAALEQYNSAEAREILGKFKTMSYKANEGLAKPAYELKGRAETKVTAKNLGFDELATKEAIDPDSFMAEMARLSAANGNATDDRRTVDIIPDEYKRRDDPVDSEAADAASFFNDLN
jgi:hypothetical protein